jgi:DnaJ-class molecular chaperone
VGDRRVECTRCGGSGGGLEPETRCPSCRGVGSYLPSWAEREDENDRANAGMEEAKREREEELMEARRG